VLLDADGGSRGALTNSAMIVIATTADVKLGSDSSSASTCGFNFTCCPTSTEGAAER